jgi:glycosyltransferase involved in cell wall biosynthesis
MQIILKSIPDLTLLIAGTGPQEAELKKLSSKLGISENTIFLGPRFDTPELYKLFDIFVLPSISEGLPMVILEAMVAGCPIIATNVGGNYTAIEQNYNGSLVKSKDPLALAVEVINLISDEIIKTKYVENGKKKFMQKFHSDIMTEKYETLYLEKC